MTEAGQIKNTHTHTHTYKTLFFIPVPSANKDGPVLLKAPVYCADSGTIDVNRSAEEQNLTEEIHSTALKPVITHAQQERFQLTKARTRMFLLLSQH